MFYSTDENRHGLAHDPFKAIVSPRPIGWIGTKGRDGSLNLSPYSFFNAICDSPKLVMFASSGAKDSLRNARETGVFTASLASRHLAEQMNASSISVEYGVDEFAIAGLTARQGTLVDAPFVAEAYAALECRVTEIIEPKTIDGSKAEAIVVFGQVVGIHLSEDILREGRVDMGIARPLGRMGYRDYADGGAEVFEMTRPSTPKG
jgi:flavin reductase (DIM6/NTAB) family NADH-FMN oxidoreductase RutF